MKVVKSFHFTLNFIYTKHSFALNRRFYSEIKVCTRFAPSPTGQLHIGGLRTAFLNFIHAKQKRGCFIVRIEDTDQERVVKGSVEEIFNALDWCGLNADESAVVGGDAGPYVQSERKEIYQMFAKQLVEHKYAYKCFCSEHRLKVLKHGQSGTNSALRWGYDNRCRSLTQARVDEYETLGIKPVIRLKLPDTVVEFTDYNFGPQKVHVKSTDGDPILLKSNGMPVYHLANVVDDHLMRVSRVIRGSEWLTSTPKHILIYRALGWQPPQFCHLPLLLTSQGKKLSKRSPEFSEVGEVSRLRQEGYFPLAVLRWLAAVGGGFRGSFRQLHSMQDFIDKFDISLMTQQSSQIDLDLFGLICREEFDRLVTEEMRLLQRHLHAYHEQFHPNEPMGNDLQLLKILPALRGRVRKMSDLLGPTAPFNFLWRKPTRAQLSPETAQLLGKIDSIFIRQLVDKVPASHQSFLQAIKHFSFAHGLPTRQLMAALRMALTGQQEGLPVIELFSLLQEDEVVERIENAKKYTCK